MGKSAWVSFCGWAVIACLTVLVTVAAINASQPVHVHVIPLAVGSVALALSFPFFVLWALGSIVHRFRAGTAKLRAAALVEATQQAGLPALPMVPSIPRKTVTPATVIVCGVCNRAPAMVRCMEHGVLLCQDCWGPHQSMQHGAAGAAAAGARG